MSPRPTFLRLAPLEILLLVISLAHIAVAPYTKVEESFSLHAVYDILSKGFLSPDVMRLYDHVEFAGAVPRSFVGPLVLSGLVYPWLFLGKLLGIRSTGLQVQILVRTILAITNCTSLVFLTRRVRKIFGRRIEKYTLLITMTQFHLLFYIGRTLPNMFAFPLVQIATALLLSPRGSRTRKGKGPPIQSLVALGLSTFSAIVMRLEILGLLAPLVFTAWWFGGTTLMELVVVGGIAGLGSLAVTVGVDSYFWNRLVWPEGAGILFNVIEGNSSSWGVSPYHYYFTNSLPRLLNFSLPLALFAMLLDRRCRSLGLPAISFIVALSCLGHKEWRFWVYVIPCLNVCAACGVGSLELLYSKNHKRLALGFVIVTNLVLTTFSLYASHFNYPGGVASSVLWNLLPTSSPHPLSIHLDSHTCMTGFSNFLPSSSLSLASDPPFIHYNKSESLSLPSDYLSFDYLLTTHPDLHEEGFEIHEVVKGFKGFKVRKPSKEVAWPLSVRMEESVWILKKREIERETGEGI